MIFIGYATLNTPYVDIIESQLIPSLKKWKLDYDIAYIKDGGSWQKNTAMKCEVIKEMLLKHRQSVVVLDADATIEKNPSLFYSIPKSIDLAYHHFDWSLFWRGKTNPEQKLQLLSGTMYWAFNAKVLSLIDEWIIKVNENINQWEQVTLQNIVENHSELNIYNLPIEYCCIIKKDGTYPDYIGEPVIKHHQASRQYKKWHMEQQIKKDRILLDKH